MEKHEIDVTELQAICVALTAASSGLNSTALTLQETGGSLRGKRGVSEALGRVDHANQIVKSLLEKNQKGGSKFMRKTGFYVWVYAEKTWHRTLSGARGYANSSGQWASDVQIVDVATGDKVN